MTLSSPASQGAAPKANGRPRKNPSQGLPKRVQLRSGTFYYIHRGTGKWENVGKDLAAATKAAAEFNAGIPVSTSMAYWLDRWVKDDLEPRLEAGDIGARTVEDYKKYATKLKLYFGKMKPSQIEPKHVTAYVALGLKMDRAVQCNREKAGLSICFSWLYANGLAQVKLNPCKGVARNAEFTRERYVSDEEYRAVHAVASPVVRVFLELIYRTLQRPGDVISWTRSKNVKVIDGKQVLHFEQNKTKKRLSILIDDNLRDMFDKMKAARPGIESDYLVYAEDGAPYTDAGISSMARRHIAEAGVEGMTPYDLKAKAASDMARAAGGASRAIMHLCGHTSIKTTEKYIREHQVDAMDTNKHDPKLSEAPGQKPRKLRKSIGKKNT